tara:strand:+ start:2149 stop:2895 length:747 start_codon:yes stop_codon:yes gene_type:complete
MTKKKILVTGSSRGIGYFLAESLLEDGHNVVFSGRRKKVFEKIKKKKNKIDYVIGDFSKPKDAKKGVKQAIKILKGIDVLICNVGESKSCAPNKEYFDEWLKMFNQNFFSATNAIENCKKNLIKSKGVIICISSICGNELIKGAPVTYSTAKAALNFYSKSLSHYLGPLGVRINIISPGNILFPGSVWDKKLKKNYSTTKKLIKNNVPSNLFGSRSDITNLVKYLISPKAKFINGSNFVIDGGQTIKI